MIHQHYFQDILLEKETNILRYIFMTYQNQKQKKAAIHIFEILGIRPIMLIVLLRILPSSSILPMTRIEPSRTIPSESILAQTN